MRKLMFGRHSRTSAFRRRAVRDFDQRYATTTAPNGRVGGSGKIFGASPLSLSERTALEHAWREPPGEQAVGTREGGPRSFAESLPNRRVGPGETKSPAIGMKRGEVLPDSSSTVDLIRLPVRSE